MRTLDLCRFANVMPLLPPPVVQVLAVPVAGVVSSGCKPSK
jgi:hypothetical protein